jgi:hypothetical protein
MKARYGLLLLFTALLAGCAEFPDFGGTRRPTYRAKPRVAVPSTANDTNAIFNEANRLALRVKDGGLTRLEAVDQLNRYRVDRVGHNYVDDNTFATYRALTLARERGQINQDQLRARMQSRLQEWQARWPNLKQRPANPAFTNFLMEVYNYPPLRP